MAKNNNLHAAKAAKNDDFYTQLTDIEKELMHYKEHFEGKTVLCNCDDPKESAFWKYFDGQFNRLGLRRLIATHYEPGGQSYVLDRTRMGSESPTVIRNLTGDGDFRSDECIELLKQADIVVTNPPFSLFREYIAQLMEYGKKFIIIGNPNAITYKEFFPLLKENNVWVGYKSMGSDMLFDVSAEFAQWLVENKKEGSGYKIVDGVVKGRAAAIWFTNLDIQKRHEVMDLYERYEGNEDHYPKYDNYDAIEVSKVVEIPRDYFGVMGVPITFLDKYNPDQFEIVGITLGNTVNYEMTNNYTNAIQHNKDGSTQGGSKVNTRAAILVKDKPVDTVYYTAENSDGYLLSIYPRILIKRKEQPNAN